MSRASLPISRLMLFFVVAVLLCAMSSVVIVPENQQVVITRLGKPISVVNRFRPDKAQGFGVVLKLPFVDQAVPLDRGLQGLELAGQQVDSKDGVGLVVNLQVTYRIIDPARLVEKFGSTERLAMVLNSSIPQLTGERLGQLPAATIALPGSGGAAQSLLADCDRKAREFGIQIVDLRVGKVALGEASLKTAFDIMQDRHLRVLADIGLASNQESRQIRADVDAENARIMQESAGRDPEFYAFFRALRSYDTVMYQPDASNPKTIVIPPDSAYLRYFNGR